MVWWSWELGQFVILAPTVVAQRILYWGGLWIEPKFVIYLGDTNRTVTCMQPRQGWVVDLFVECRVKISSLPWLLYEWRTNLDFSNAVAVPSFFISSTKRELKILIPLGISEIATTSKVLFSSTLLISFCLDSVKGDWEVSLCSNMEMSAICWNLTGKLWVRAGFWRGVSGVSMSTSLLPLLFSSLNWPKSDSESCELCNMGFWVSECSYR